MPPSLNNLVTENKKQKSLFLMQFKKKCLFIFSLKQRQHFFILFFVFRFWSFTDVMMWTLVIFTHFCNILTFPNILIGYHVHGPLPTKQNLDHGFGKLQSVFHSYFHIRNVNEDVCFETPLFQRCLEFI